MKLKLLAFSLISIFVIASCAEKENCRDIECVVEPSPLYIDLIDEQSNENIFAAGILVDSTDLYLINSELEDLKFSILKDSYLMEVPDITSEEGPYVYQIIIRSDYIITFKLDMKTEEIDCCKNYFYRDFSAAGLTSEFNEADMTAKIFINLNR